MKKYLCTIIGLLVALLFYSVATRTKPPASPHHAPNPESSGDTASTETNTAPKLTPIRGIADSGLVLRKEQISLVDRRNPAYATVLEVMGRTFLAVIKSSSEAQKYSDEQLAEQANLLAVVRLSQTMYEATIASVAPTDTNVSISIPPYHREGSDLENYVFKNLLADYRDETLKHSITKQFGYFGKYSQTIGVVAHGVDHGEKMYLIEHQINITDIVGSVRTNSVLSDRQLGRYTPFAGWFPKT